MGKTITIILSKNNTISKVLFTVRGYGDPIMVDLMGLDTNLFGVGNFQNVCVYDPNRDGFGAVSYFQNMDKSALDYLASIQPNDGFTVKQKLGWLGLPDSQTGRPYMVNSGIARWGLMVFGLNKVQVESNNGIPVSYTFRARFQSRKTYEDIEMYKLVMFRKSDTYRSVNSLLKEGLIHKATEAFYPSNKPGFSPRGEIYQPVWSPKDWNTNSGYSDDLYIPEVFLQI